MGQRPWEEHELLLAAVESAADPSTRTRPEHTSVSYPPGSSSNQVLDDYKRDRLKIARSNNMLLRVVVFLIVGSVIITLLGVLFGDKQLPGGPKGHGDFDVFMPADINMKLDSLVGLSVVKAAIQQVLHPLPIAGLKPMRGMFMFGPPGCGKTTIVKAAAGERGIPMISVKCSSITSSYYGQSAANIRRAFTLASSMEPCILFFDEIDSLMGDKSKSGGGDLAERESGRIVSEFLTQMTQIMDDASSRVFVFAATNYPEKIDAAVMRRFEKKVMVPLPRFEARWDMLRRTYPNLRKHQLDELADLTYGYSSADLEKIEKEVYKVLVDRVGPDWRKRYRNRTIRPDFDTIKDATLRTASSVSERDVRRCRAWARNNGADVEQEDRPSNRPRRAGGIAMNEEEQAIADNLIVPDKTFPTFDSVAGLEQTKSVLKSIVYGMIQGGTGQGMLLYGPPGTGKSTLVRAAAKFASDLPGERTPWRILNIHSQSIYSKWQGESEQRMDAVFRVAEAYQPCIIVFDEMDKLFSRTVQGQTAQQGVSDAKVQSAFQTSMDDITRNKCKILVVGTTNHPDAFDDAMRRRLKPALYVPLPGREARRQIFEQLLMTPRVKYADKDLDAFAKATVGWSGDDIRRAVVQARQTMVLTLLAENNRKDSPDDIRPDILSNTVRNFTSDTNFSNVKELHSWPYGDKFDMEESDILDKVYYLFHGVF